MLLLLVLAIGAAVSVSRVGAGSGVVVSTRYGAVRGFKATLGPQSSVDIFLGIPYARPPVGYLRFHKPVPHDPWSGVRDALTTGPSCPQQNTTFYTPPRTSEDCLYLNVYTPKSHNAGHHPLPVMVWIHGGGYYIGSGDSYNGTLLAAKGVVVVTINYRLGALGFVSSMDDAMPGNNGLRDQIVALEWVRDVISAFNGNPHDVTIFGESAGSSSVSLLTLSHAARGLFSKAIMESGVSLSPWAMNSPTYTRAETQRLGTVLGCDQVTNSFHLAACLRTKSTEDILAATPRLEADSTSIAFAPVVDSNLGSGGLLSMDPEDVLTNGQFNNVTVIRGFTSQEAGGFYGNLDQEDDGFTMAEFLNLTRSAVEDSLVTEYDGLDADRALQIIVDTYVTRLNATQPKQLRDAYLQFQSDFSMVAPTMKEQRLFFNSGGSTQFLYRFDFRSANRLTAEWKGVGHADDIRYVFGEPFAPATVTNDPGFVSDWTEADRRVSNEVMTMWTNFAKYGNPTPVGSSLTRWLPWTPSTPGCLNIGDQSSMISAAETSRIRMWNDVIPNVRQAVVG